MPYAAVSGRREAHHQGVRVIPLTKKGAVIKRAMVKEYGEKRGENVLYASANAGKISGIERKGKAKASKDKDDRR
jgi:hypothetical protein